MYIPTIKKTLAGSSKNNLLLRVYVKIEENFSLMATVITVIDNCRSP